jgi:hypothetical protein
VTSEENGSVGRDVLDKRNESWHLWIVNLKSVSNTNGVFGRKPTITTSAPPSSGGLNGPPFASQYRFALSSIHDDNTSNSSLFSRCSASLTPWRMLCMFFVRRKTPGFGFGTYLRISVIILIAAQICKNSPLQVYIQQFTESE